MLQVLSSFFQEDHAPLAPDSTAGVKKPRTKQGLSTRAHNVTKGYSALATLSAGLW